MKRDWPIAVVLVAALAAGLGGVRLTPRAPTLGDRIGFSVGGELLGLPPAQMRRDLDDIERSGARWVRADLAWSSIEERRGHRSWSDVDRLVRESRARGLSVLGLLAYTPAWARPGCATDKCPPDDPQDFASFARAAAERYDADDVAAWEVWNEPNIPEFWSPRPDIDRYARLLDVTVSALRAARPRAIVVSAGLAPAASETSGGQVAPVDVIGRLYELGVAQRVDAIGIHPYAGTDLPLDAPEKEFARLPALHRVLLEHGAAGTPMWITEYGVSTDQTSTRRQAAALQQALRRLEDGQWPWLQVLFVYRLRDAEDGYGVLREDRTPKPAWSVVRAAAAGRLR